MVAAGLLARKAVEKGLSVKPYVKTSLAPGSRVVTDYLNQAGLIEPLVKLGFNVVGYGCTTCIGNSGPLPGEVAKAVSGSDLVAAAVISGNRNFEGRVHPLVKANYLASPPLVVAYALAGTVDIDLLTEPVGMGKDGPVYLKDLWPTTGEVAEVVGASLHKNMFEERYSSVFEGSSMWKDIKVSGGDLFQWDEASTYIHHPPFFQELTLEVPSIQDIKGARGAGLAGRFDHHRSYFPGRQHCHRQPGGAFPAGARHPTARFQFLWRPPRQRPGDGARYFCEYPLEEPACARSGRRRHALFRKTGRRRGRKNVPL